MAAQHCALYCACENCNCDTLRLEGPQTRTCANCKHDFIAHALHRSSVRLPHGTSKIFSSTCCLLMLPPERPNIESASKIASMFLFRTQAIPIRAKILLQKVFNALSPDETHEILDRFGWNLDQFQRGYFEKDLCGTPLYSWITVGGGEELVALQQFIRFDCTRSTVSGMLQNAVCDAEHVKASIITDGHLQPHFNHFLHKESHSMHINTSTNIPSTLSAHVSPASVHGEYPMSCGSPTLSCSPRLCRSADNFTDYTRRHSPADAHTALSFQDYPQDLSVKKQRPLLSACNWWPRGSGYWTEDTVDEDFGLSEHGQIPMDSNNHIDWPAILAKKGRVVQGLSGKKRVWCNTCRRTYCDKGAFKIHYNAVHIKTKHTCSIKGCTKVFSSRRSRNRHSCNTNMKLHLPDTPLADTNSQHGLHNDNNAEEPAGDVRDCDSASDSTCSIPSKRRRKNQPTKLSPQSAHDYEGKSVDWEAYNSYANGSEPLVHSNAAQMKAQYSEHNQPLDLCAKQSALAFTVDGEEDSASDSRASTDPIYSVQHAYSPHNSSHSETPRVYTKNVVMVRCKTPEGSAIEIPMDEDNPKRCTWCGNILQNHFSVKTHYLNVHLKLLHKCFIPGCTAAFPSKRSRDRHSINKKLHDKKMSIPGRETSDECGPPNVTITNNTPNNNNTSVDNRSCGVRSPAEGMGGRDGREGSVSAVPNAQLLIKYQSMLAAHSLLLASRYRGPGTAGAMPFLAGLFGAHPMNMFKNGGTLVHNAQNHVAHDGNASDAPGLQ